MGQTIKAIIFCIVLVVVGGLIGRFFAGKLADAFWMPQVVSYRAQIDSMQVVVDSVLAELDMEYAKNQRVIVKTKIKYIEKAQEDDKNDYFALDTLGRVEHFRGRVRKIAGNKYEHVELEFGIDEPFDN